MNEIPITKAASGTYETPEVIVLSVSIETGYASSNSDTNGTNEPFTSTEGVWD